MSIADALPSEADAVHRLASLAVMALISPSFAREPCDHLESSLRRLPDWNRLGERAALSSRAPRLIKDPKSHEGEP